MSLTFGPFAQYQATAPATMPLPPRYFEDGRETAVYWLSASGVLVNSHGFTLMIDPLLSVVSDDPAIGETGELLLTAPPILATQVENLDAVLYTHTDNDHLGPITAQALMQTGAQFHGPPLVIQELRRLGLAEGRGISHPPGEAFGLGNLELSMTPAFHPHQLFNTDFDRYFTPEDCCGYKITTRDGVVWIPGDSLLLPEHLQMTDIDVMFIDFSDNRSHVGLDFAIGLANVLEHAELIMYHFATFYGPEHDWCNADPATAIPRLRHPERLHILAPGEKYVVHQRGPS